MWHVWREQRKNHGFGGLRERNQWENLGVRGSNGVFKEWDGDMD
jgi:hypothetical protein